MEYVVAPIGQEHVEAFHAALDSVARERVHLALLEAPPIEQTRQFVEGNVAAGIPQFVALIDGRVIGWCDIVPNRRPALAHVGDFGMGVVREFRGQGIGADLARATIEAAWRYGLLRVSLSVRSQNIAARRLYERLGFRHEGTLAKAVRFDQQFDDVIVMGLLRDSTSVSPKR